MNNEINEKDIVIVNFNNCRHTLVSRGEVLHVPCATGDSWHIRDLENGTIHYISEGCTVSKIANNRDIHTG